MKKVLNIIAALFIASLVMPSPMMATTSFTSNNCTTKVGSAALPSGATPGCAQTGGVGGGSVTACASAPAVNFTSVEQYHQAILSKFGLDLVLTLDQMQYAWEEFYAIACTGFLNDIRGTTMRSWRNSYSQQFACPQDTSQPSVMVGAHHGEFVKALLVHELTHVWQHCSQRGEASLFDNTNAYNAEGGLTTYSRNQCGGSLFTSATPWKEDHADAIALFLNPWSGELTCGSGRPNPYLGGKYPLHYNASNKYVHKT